MVKILIWEVIRSIVLISVTLLIIYYSTGAITQTTLTICIPLFISLFISNIFLEHINRKKEKADV